MNCPGTHSYSFAPTLAVVLFLVAGPARATDAPEPTAVVEHYADLAHAVYSDSLETARRLSTAVDEFLNRPTPVNLEITRDAWKAARVPYSQSEIHRFGNPPVDAWEGRVNAWPLDEGLIDYVVGASPYEAEQGNEAARANVVTSQRIEVFGRTIDADTIDIELLNSLHELGGAEANVATGYHAIEFLLWGRDHNEQITDAGQRPVSDYYGQGCTSGRDNPMPASVCARRAQYLATVTDLLVKDMESMVAEWAPDRDDNYRAELLAASPEEGLRRMLRGIGAMAGGELSNERMRAGLLAKSQEEEQSCFSDNTHVDIVENARGIRNVYYGEYRRIDGTVLRGPSLHDLVRATTPELDRRVRASLANTMQAVSEIATATLLCEPFDQQIRLGNSAGAARIGAAIEALNTDTGLTVDVAGTLGIEDLNTAL